MTFAIVTRLETDVLEGLKPKNAPSNFIQLSKLIRSFHSHNWFSRFLLQVMEMLLKIPADYWEQFVNIKSDSSQSDKNEHREEFGRLQWHRWNNRAATTNELTDFSFILFRNRSALSTAKATILCNITNFNNAQEIKRHYYTHPHITGVRTIPRKIYISTNRCHTNGHQISSIETFFRFFFFALKNLFFFSFLFAGRVILPNILPSKYLLSIKMCNWKISFKKKKEL